MLNFKDFYRIRKYTNIAWKGRFTDEEVAEQAYDDYTEYQRIEGNPSDAYINDFQTLYEGLMEDLYTGLIDDDVEYFVETLKSDFASWKLELSSPYDGFKKCSFCGETMKEGYFIKGERPSLDEVFCSKECLRVHYSDEENLAILKQFCKGKDE